MKKSTPKKLTVSYYYTPSSISKFSLTKKPKRTLKIKTSL